MECTLIGYGGSKCAYRCKYKGNEYCILLPHKVWNNALNEPNNTLILKKLGLLVNDICEIIKIKINNEDFPAIITSLYDSHKYKIFDCKNKNNNLNDYYDFRNLNEDTIKYFFADILEDIKILIKNNIFLEQDSYNFAIKNNAIRLFFNDLPYAQLEKIKNNKYELKRTYISYVINNFLNILSGDIILTNTFLKKIYKDYDYLESIIDELSKNI